MNLLSLEMIQKNHRKELEQRLKNAENNLKNLDRMAEEAFREIDRRASEDKENLSKIFHTLTANEEVTISSLKEELGMDQGAFNQFVQTFENVEIPSEPKPKKNNPSSHAH